MPTLQHLHSEQNIDCRSESALTLESARVSLQRLPQTVLHVVGQEGLIRTSEKTGPIRVVDDGQTSAAQQG